jgi:hypothetical protein
MKDKTQKMVSALVFLVIWLGNLFLALYYYNREDLFAFILFRVVIVLAALGFFYNILQWRRL